MLNPREYTTLDKICFGFDQMVNALWGKPTHSARSYPAAGEPEPTLTSEQQKHVAGLMRVNHAGEICAQALYRGQQWVSRSPALKASMAEAAREEEDHLAWCQQRLTELGSHASYLNPFWYTGALSLGLIAGLMGDKWGLGFVAETETQVVAHLQHHLTILPEQDIKSYKILQQMQSDEAEHRDGAIRSGAALLPKPVKQMMRAMAKVMVKLAYWL